MSVRKAFLPCVFACVVALLAGVPGSSGASNGAIKLTVKDGGGGIICATKQEKVTEKQMMNGVCSGAPKKNGTRYTIEKVPAGRWYIHIGGGVGDHVCYDKAGGDGRKHCTQVRVKAGKTTTIDWDVPVYGRVSGRSRHAKSGNLITFDNRFGINSVHADGHGVDMLIGNSGARNAVWSPNGRRIAYEQRNHYSEISGSTKIRFSKANGKGRKTLTKGYAPVWLSNSRVAYMEGGKEATKDLYGFWEGVPGKVFVMNIKTEKRTMLAREGSTALSENKNRMAYILHRGGGRSRIVVSSIKTGRQLESFKLRPRPATVGPGWIGNRYVFQTCRPRKHGVGMSLCWFDVQTGKVKVVHPGNAYDARNAALSPSGEKVAWAALSGIYVTDSHGKHAELAWKNTGLAPSYFPIGVSWRP